MLTVDQRRMYDFMNRYKPACLWWALSWVETWVQVVDLSVRSWLKALFLRSLFSDCLVAIILLTRGEWCSSSFPLKIVYPHSSWQTLLKRHSWSCNEKVSKVQFETTVGLPRCIEQENKKTLEPLKNKLRSKFEVVASVVMTLCTTTVMKATADTTQ